ncbi:UvrD-helicase domain-containing protein [Psychrobacillus sp. L4]|uniref:UvrD-helicase domain-containing protein n=1 Tax=Psychrobacillus sp. L4 TaxID=3236892 RepID=UPI0036F33989
MQVKEEDYELVESILLDNKGQFNSLQREFIELFETKTIIAGPGAGKTTALAAKIVILLKNLNATKSKDGVFIITHTNVAVSEINKALLKAGVGAISHPHFIGTIHEFFNRFCVIPYFKYKYHHSNLIFDNEDNSGLEYYRTFIGRKIPWINEEKFKRFKDSLSEKINKSELFLNEDNSLNLNDTTNWDKFEKYRELMIKAKFSRKIKGFLSYDETFLFSKIFLLEDKFKEVLRKRFKYIFLDEFQDTHPQGMNLLDELFVTTNNVYQKIGDPYQTITFNQPMPTVRDEDLFRINITNRFGQEIAEHLNIIMPDSNMQSMQGKKSLPPIILIYKDKKDIYPTFKRLIRDHEGLDSNFKESDRRDKVLVLERKWASDVKDGVLYKEKKQRSSLSKNDVLKSLIIDFIIKRIVNEGGNLSEVKEWLKNHSQILSLHKLLIKIIKKGSIDEVENELKNLINAFLEERGSSKINISNKLFQNLKEITVNIQVSNENEDDEDDIFTIHAVKGETLRSVLLVDFEQKHLTKVMLHKYGILEEDNYGFTHQNLLYVAMSRVTHLFVFAIEESDWTPEIKAVLEQKWRIVETKSPVEV